MKLPLWWCTHLSIAPPAGTKSSIHEPLREHFKCKSQPTGCLVVVILFLFLTPKPTLLDLPYTISREEMNSFCICDPLMMMLKDFSWPVERWWPLLWAEESNCCSRAWDWGGPSMECGACGECFAVEWPKWVKDRYSMTLEDPLVCGGPTWTREHSWEEWHLNSHPEKQW
jgi:hypothetical protein